MEGVIAGDDGRFGSALGASLVAHILLLVAGGLLVTQQASIPLSQGFVVELVQYDEPVVTKVEAPVESAAQLEGTVAVPKPKPKPKTKPKTKPRATPTRTEPQTKAAEPTEPKAAVSPPPDAQPGSGGQIQTEVPFPFDYYTEMITRRIYGQWVPTSGMAAGTSAVIAFDIYRDGSVNGVKVVTASGIELFDASTLAAVRSVGTFPPLPQGFPDNRIRIRFHFDIGQDS